MAEPGGAAQRPKKKSGGFGWLVLGIILGVLGAIFLPDLAAPYLPAGLRGGDEEVAGVVKAKAREPERLLLTVGSEAGAILVTYTENVPEIDLLVGVGDSVLLAVDEYAPFVRDADIRRVMKRSDWRAPPASPAGTAAASDTAAGAAVSDTVETSAADADSMADTAAARIDSLTGDSAAAADTGPAPPPR